MITSPYFGHWSEAAEEERRLQGKSSRGAALVTDSEEANEEDVIILLLEGKTNEEISDLLGCSIFAVEDVTNKLVSMGTPFKKAQRWTDSSDVSENFNSALQKGELLDMAGF
jgi:transposase